MAKWEIIEDTKFKKQTGGKAAATRAVTTKNSKNNPKMLSEVTVVEPKTVTKNKLVIQKPNLAPYYVPAQDATYRDQPIIDKLKAQGIELNTKPKVDIIDVQKKLNNLKSVQDSIGSLNGGLGPSNFFDMLKQKDREQEMGILESKYQDQLPHKPLLDKANAVGTSMLTIGKYFAPPQVRQGIDYFLNAQDVVELYNNPTDTLNQASVGSDALSFIKSKKTGSAPFNYAGDLITLKQKYDLFNKASNQKYQNGGKAAATRTIASNSKPVVIQKPNLAPYYVPAQDATYRDQPIIDKLKAQGIELNTKPELLNNSVIASIPVSKNIDKPVYTSVADYTHKRYGAPSVIPQFGQSVQVAYFEGEKPPFYQDVAENEYKSYSKYYSKYYEQEKINDQVSQFLKANPIPKTNKEKADYIKKLSPYDRQLIQSSSLSNEFLPAFRQYDNQIGEDAKKYTIADLLSDPTRFSKVAKAGLNRFRFFPNATNSYEDLINPGLWFGKMEQGVGDIPKNIKEENYLAATMGVVNPLLMGRVAGSGSINPLGKSFWTNEVSNAQFVNNLVNPLAGIVDANTVKGLGNKAVDKYIGSSFTPELSNVGIEVFGAGKPTAFKSEINWGNWNPDTPKYPELISEYNAIEEATKADGTWMKNPDGSPFQGTPEQFIQQNSQNFKKAFGDTPNIAYRGQTRPTETIGGGNRGYAEGISYLGDKDQALTYAKTWKHPRHSGKIYQPGVSDPNAPALYELMYPSSTNKKIITHSEPRSWQKLTDDDVASQMDQFELELRGKSHKGEQFINTDDVGNYVARNNLDYAYIPKIMDYAREPSRKFFNLLPGKNVGNTIIMNSKPGNYLKSRWYNNGMFDMTNPNIYKSITPFVIGLGAASALQQKKHGGIIEDPMGQWAHPGKITQIPSNQITMQGVNYPVLGISDKGHTQMMYPGLNYFFKGNSVTEYPMMQGGGQILLRNQILNTKLPATNQPTFNPNFNRSTPTTSPLSLQVLGKKDYGVSLNKNGLNFSGGLNLEDKKPAFRAGINYRKGNWSGNINYSTDNNNFGTQVGYNNNGFNAGARYQRNNGNNSFNANVGYHGDSPVSFDVNYAYDKGHSFDTNVGLNLGKFSGGLNYGYNQEGDKAHNFGANANLGLGKNLNLSADANFDSNKNYQVNAGLKYNFQDGGEVNFTYAGENHRVYKKESSTGNGKGLKGHIMVNHPTEDKGKWDTIDLTKITNGRVKTVAQGVASTKKWHDENPEYANGGQVSSWEIIEDLPKAQNGRFTNPPIYVNDPNDPRLGMYNDSLNLYKAYQFQKNHSERNDSDYSAADDSGNKVQKSKDLNFYNSILEANKLNFKSFADYKKASDDFNNFVTKPNWYNLIKTEPYKSKYAWTDQAAVFKNTEDFKKLGIKSDYDKIKYYESLNFSHPEDVAIVKSSSADIGYKRIKPIGSYWGGKGFNPIYAAPKQPYILGSAPFSTPSIHSPGTVSYLTPTFKTIPNLAQKQQDEIIPFNKMGLENLDSLQSMQKIPEPNPITSVPKDYITITTGSSYRNPETGAFEQKTFKIDKKTGKRLTEPSFKSGGKVNTEWEIIEDLDELDEYQKGGKTKKELKDIYGNKILAPIVKVEERSHYDPLSETIYLNSQDYNNPYIVAHENLHALQNKLGTDRFWENRLIPLKKPNIVATPDEAVDYYDRKAIETGIDTNRFLNKNPEFQFVPFNTYYARGIEDQQYDNPESLEGEARYYENTGKVLPPYKLGGKTKNSNWEIIEDDNEIPEYKHGGKTPAWQRKEGKSPTGGLNAKGRASLKKEGHDIKPPQPQGGSRKKSFCARMTGLKKKLTGSKKANDPNSRVNLSLKKWKC